MCGITGMVGIGTNPETLQRMTDAVQHRGPDGDGYWQAERVAFGHRRLRIIDLSDAGRQPMSTPDGRYTIVYNGEVYNYIELRRELPDITYHSTSDTEVILHAFAHWGPAALEKFIGMYALAIWDNHEQRLFCARDRLGIKPFYFAYTDDAFVFGSEIAALFAASVAPNINHGVLYDFLARDFYEHTDETFFSNVHKLPAGHWMWIDRDGMCSTPQSYWDFAAEVASQTLPATRIGREDRLLELATDAIDIHLRSDVPVGVAMSGGLDSSTLLKLLDKVHPNPTRVEAFSFAFNDPAYSERPFVEKMAQATGRAAHFVEISPQMFVQTVPEFVQNQGEPFAGLPISAYAHCFRLAHEHGFIVIMDGSGIDEGLAGYTRFRPAYWADLFEQGNFDTLNRELSASGINTSQARHHALSQMQHASRPSADVGMGQDLTVSAKADCLTGDFLQFAKRPLPAFDRPFNDHLHNLMYRELFYTKLPRALRFRDRLSMAVGCELRPPFLDHRLLAYQFALPSSDLIENGISKSILRTAANRLLPDAVRMASKRSVQTPQREWFRNELQSWVRDRIDTPRFWQRGWVDQKRGKAAMEAYFRGEGDNSFFLWQWLNLEQWAQSVAS